MYMRYLLEALGAASSLIVSISHSDPHGGTNADVDG